MKRIFLLIFCSFFLIACEKNNDNHKIYFEHYVSTFGWNRSSFHWIIDNEGNVFSKRRNDYSILSNSNDLNEVYLKFDSLIYNIEKAELEKYIALIEPASKGKIDSIPQTRADFGTTGYNCFLYYDVNNTCDIIVLSQMSNLIDLFNTDSSAVKIVNWLKDINIKIYSN